MAAQNSQGITTLLEAEKEAAKTVQRARQYRVQRLKDARTEAAKEIEALKTQKNAEFQEFEAMHTGSSDQSFARVTTETEQKLQEVQAAVQKNHLLVTERLLTAITKVEPKIHRNFRHVEQS
ncbi:13064_t:CDS:2 [Ambispora gerdemannii]|uniref:V-type proton ATPase subunit G n=1 Tax=Ambispora gerdemannii TaxID=144530 RepID=A0A9N8V064_9GLOM|nr:13064_t:CDS:2 [Ambispora gerdemannii]